MTRIALLASAATAVLFLAVTTTGSAAPDKTAPKSTAVPTISGTVAVGTKLTASTGSWDSKGSTSYKWQWKRCDTSGTTCVPIANAVLQAYTPTSAELGLPLVVEVTATNPWGATAASSKPSAPVAAPAAPPTAQAPANTSVPKISGTAQQGSTLTASVGSWTGTTPMTYTYQWYYCDAAGATCSPITGYTSSTYTPVADDIGGANKVRVTATNSAGTAQAFSAATSVVSAPSTTAPTTSAPANTALPTIAGTAQVGQKLTAAVGTWTGTAPFTYQYQWNRCGTGGCSAIVGATTSTYVLASTDAGSTFSVTVRATNAVGTATATSVATAAVATASTTSPTTTGTVWFSDSFENGSTSSWLKSGAAAGFLAPVSGAAGNGVGLAVGPSYGSTGPNSSSELVSLWQYPQTAHAGYGKTDEETWYRIRMKFPSAYKATRGEWNWLVEWHNDNTTASYSGCYSIALGVLTDYTADGSANVNPRLNFRLMGGSTSAPQSRSFSMPSNSLKRDHWYDITFRFVWSKSSSVGRADVWVDGQQWVSQQFPTLYTRPDGTASYNNFGLYNYRLSASWDAAVQFDEVRIGSSQSAVS